VKGASWALGRRCPIMLFLETTYPLCLLDTVSQGHAHGRSYREFAYLQHRTIGTHEIVHRYRRPVDPLIEILLGCSRRQRRPLDSSHHRCWLVSCQAKWLIRTSHTLQHCAFPAQPE
jgi:hypothetical protein